MSAVFTTLLALALLSVGASAQPSLVVFAGYGQSAFEDQDDAAGYVPVGAQVLFEAMPGLSVGGELNYAVVPFTWELEEMGTEFAESKVTQMLIGGVAKYEVGQGALRPHARGGVGMYMGKMKFDFESEYESYTPDVEEDFKNAIGFNLGGGITADFGENKMWIAEFVYHIVSRELDVQGAESEGANNWAIHLGAGIKF